MKLCLLKLSAVLLAFGDMAISNVAQFGLLLWKNWLLQKRRVGMAMFQIIIPVGVAALLLLIRLVAKTKFEPLPTIFDSFEANASFPPNLIVPVPANLGVNATGIPWMIVCSPSTSQVVNRIGRNIARMLQAIPQGMMLLCCRLIRMSITCSLSVNLLWLIVWFFAVAYRRGLGG